MVIEDTLENVVTLFDLSVNVVSNVYHTFDES